MNFDSKTCQILFINRLVDFNCSINSCYVNEIDEILFQFDIRLKSIKMLIDVNALLPANDLLYWQLPFVICAGSGDGDCLILCMV